MRDRDPVAFSLCLVPWSDWLCSQTAAQLRSCQERWGAMTMWQSEEEGRERSPFTIPCRSLNPLFFPLEVPWRDIFNCIPVEFLLQLVPGLTRVSGNCEWLCLKEGGIFGGEEKSREKISSIGRGTASLHSFVIRLLQIRDSSSSFLTRSLLWRFDCLGSLRGSVCK